MSLLGLEGYESESPANTPSPRVTVPSAQEEKEKNVAVVIENPDSKTNITEPKADNADTEKTLDGEHDHALENEAAEILKQKLPDEPEGQIDSELQTKIQQEIQRKNESGVSFTLRLQKLKEFGNPYQLSLIVDYCKIDEWGSNYPKSKFDPKCDSKYYTDKLSFAPSTLTRSTSSSSRSSRGSRGGSSIQRRALLKRSSSSTDATKTTTTTSKSVKKRKWDQAGAGMSSTSSSVTTASVASDAKAIIAKTVAKKIEENLMKKKKIS